MDNIGPAGAVRNEKSNVKSLAAIRVRKRRRQERLQIARDSERSREIYRRPSHPLPGSYSRLRIRQNWDNIGSAGPGPKW